MELQRIQRHLACDPVAVLAGLAHALQGDWAMAVCVHVVDAVLMRCCEGVRGVIRASDGPAPLSLSSFCRCRCCTLFNPSVQALGY